MQVVDGPEVQEHMHELPRFKEYLLSFYKCSYASFFKALGESVRQRLMFM